MVEAGVLRRFFLDQTRADIQREIRTAGGRPWPRAEQCCAAASRPGPDAKGLL